jgi:hypothetical protein
VIPKVSTIESLLHQLQRRRYVIDWGGSSAGFGAKPALGRRCEWVVISALPRSAPAREIRAEAGQRERGLRASLRSVIRTAIWIPAATITVLMMPLLATQRTFGTDWTLHLWLIRQQQFNIEALGHPGLFTSTRHLGAFYPMFSFVGSGIYSVGAYLSILLGDRPVLAYKLLYGVGLCLAFGGMTWLSTQLGLRGWRAQAPGLTLVTSAYFVTDFVGRGDFGEFIALSSIPFVIAAARAIVTSDRLRPGHLLALVAGVFVFTGSHNLTLMYGAIFMGALAVVVVGSNLPRLPRARWSRWCAVGGAAAIGVGLNAWYLVGDVAYGLNTRTSKYNVVRVPSTELAQPGLLLNPFRPADTYSPYWRDLRFAMPWLFLMWVFIVARILWPSATGPARRLVGGLAGLVVGYVTLTTWRAPWRFVPHALYNIQITWRLNGYVLLTTALLVLVALRWEARADRSQRRAIGALLVAIVAFNLGATVWQEWRVRSEYVNGHREVVTGRGFAGAVVAARYDEPASWYPNAMYRELTPPIVPTAPGRTLDIPVRAVQGSKFAGVLAVPDGDAPFRTNLAATSHFVRLTGIRGIGRTPSGLIVAARAPGVARNGPVAVTIMPARNSLLRAGEILSLLSLAALVALIGSLIRRPRLAAADRALSRDRR